MSKLKIDIKVMSQKIIPEVIPKQYIDEQSVVIKSKPPIIFENNACCCTHISNTDTRDNVAFLELL